jgi:hypothetical protein
LIFYTEVKQMAKKRYQMKAACPQCGCTDTTTLTAEELKERYGDVPNIELECSACLLKYHTEMKSACPEWDEACRLKEESDEAHKSVEK